MDLTYDLVSEMRPKIGLIVLQADESIETDMRRMMPHDVELLVSRLPSSTEVTSDSLAQMAGVLTKSASLFPEGVKFATIGYGCTSGTAEIGVSKIAELISEGANAVEITEPVSALIAACRSLKITQIGLVSPYIAQVSETLCEVLMRAGISVTTFASFNEAEESKVVRIAPASIAKAAIEMGNSGECEAVFLSCTNLRTLDIIDDVESAIDLPVLSSNQVLGWDILRKTGGSSDGFRPGRLWG